MTERITVPQAAKKLGISPSMLRYMLLEGLVPFGTGFRRGDSERHTFVIYPEKYKEYVGSMEAEE